MGHRNRSHRPAVHWTLLLAAGLLIGACGPDTPEKRPLQFQLPSKGPAQVVAEFLMAVSQGDGATADSHLLPDQRGASSEPWPDQLRERVSGQRSLKVESIGEGLAEVSCQFHGKPAWVVPFDLELRDGTWFIDQETTHYSMVESLADVLADYSGERTKMPGINLEDDGVIGIGMGSDSDK